MHRSINLINHPCLKQRHCKNFIQTRNSANLISSKSINFSSVPCITPSFHSCRNHQQQQPRNFIDSVLLNHHKLSICTSHLYSTGTNNTMDSSRLDLTSLRCTPPTISHKNFSYESCDNQKHHWYKHDQGNQSALVKYLIGLITSMGLCYGAYKILIHKLQKNDLLPIASCASSKSYSSQSDILTECLAHAKFSCNKKVIENSKQRKIGDEVNKFGKISLAAAIEKVQRLCKRKKEEVGSPGIVVCVSVDGKQVYAEGFGYADLENQTPMKPNCVLRIASISKAITAVIVAKAWEKGLIDLEKSVQHYVSSFPQKEFMGQKVEITVKQLLSHSSGIRHYKSKNDPVYALDQPISDLLSALKDASLQPFYETGTGHGKKEPTEVKDTKNTTEENMKPEVSEMERDEYYLSKHFSTTAESLALFVNDPLVAQPGTKFVYTTFAYTLLAAVIESALKKSFTDVAVQTFKQMGLKETYLEFNDPIIYNRARYYVKDKKGNIVNAPYVDNSYKWAGGGMMSTVEDMVKFGNILLYSAQHQDEDPGLSGFLKSSTINKFWTPQGIKGAKHTYGLGFSIRPIDEQFGMCDSLGFGAGHTGAAIGASSVLFILPRHCTDTAADGVKGNNFENNTNKSSEGETLQKSKVENVSTTSSIPSMSASKMKVTSCNVPERDINQATNQLTSNYLPQGVVVCIILNMISVSANDIAEEVAKTFRNVDFTL